MFSRVTADETRTMPPALPRRAGGRQATPRAGGVPGRDPYQQASCTDDDGSTKRAMRREGVAAATPLHATRENAAVRAPVAALARTDTSPPSTWYRRRPATRPGSA